MNTSRLVEFPLELSDCCCLSIELRYTYSFDFFYTVYQIFKTISRPKWTLYLKWVQPVVRTTQTPTCNGSGFSLNGHSAHFKCVLFETLTKDECQSQKIVINMKHMLRNHPISCLYECILILLIMEEGLAHRRLILNKRSPYSLVITLFIKVCDELSLQKQTPVV